MTNDLETRESFLKRNLLDFLARRTPPERFKADDGLRAKELAALLGTVLRHAPAHEWADWWVDVEARVAESGKGHLWPTQGQIADAAKSHQEAKMGRSRPATARDGSRLPAGQMKTSAQIDAERIQRGDAVSEYRLWGRGADELLATGLVTLEDLEPYRKYMRHAWRSTYGEEEAQRLDAERVTGRYQSPGVSGTKPHAGGFQRMPGMDPSPTYRPSREDVVGDENAPHFQEPDPASEEGRQLRASRNATRASMGLPPLPEPAPPDYDLVPDDTPDLREGMA
ncbi:hypothetical protein [Rubellimicrobium arenae]|uniref:hypothetical protein n=1 Tax=Rubellimicrobium arenae TaxID=2817372 RepID=UPI001B300A7D|nr:hypothetical protein [Rubellimicrobium arenae]